MKFTAEIGGDQECFCFFVDKETYIKIVGREKYDSETAIDKESCKEIGQEFTEREKWAIYPNDLFGYDKKTAKIEIGECLFEYYIKEDGNIGLKDKPSREILITV